MKKLLVISFALILILSCLASCGNKAIFDPGTITFTHVHITDYTVGHCLEIDKWWDTESGLEVRTSDKNGIFLSEGTYQLFESKAACPYCN